MSSRRLAAVLVSISLVLGAGAAAAPTAAAPLGAEQVSAARQTDMELGTRLANDFFAALKAKDRAALAALLSPAFQIARGDGSTTTKIGYLANFPTITRYELTDFVVTRQGSDLVVRYMAAMTKVVAGKKQVLDPALQLAVYSRSGKAGAWHLTSQSNFNSSIAAPPNDRQAGTAAQKRANTALGVALANEFFALLKAQDATAVDAFLSPAFQVARSDGSVSLKAEYLTSLPVVQDFVLSDFLVTRAGPTLVVRYTATLSETINGQQFAKDPVRRLSVFTKNPATGTWRLLAHSNFSTPVS